MGDEWREWLRPLIKLAKEAGTETLKYFGLPEDRMTISRKPDGTLLTLADQEAHRILVDGLKQLNPRLPILSEEGIVPPYEIRRCWSRYWLLDPLDGTRGFINHLDEYTVNVALVDQHRVLMGIVTAPAKKLCYYAMRDGKAYKQVDEDTPLPIRVKPLNFNAIQVVLGQYLHSSRLPTLFHDIPGCEVKRLNSSLKFCWIAEGCADIYPRIGMTSEWDTAAAQCILERAGGRVVDLQGEALQYNAKESLVNPDFIAIGDPTQQDHIIDLIQKKRRTL